MQIIVVFVFALVVAFFEARRLADVERFTSRWFLMGRDSDEKIREMLKLAVRTYEGKKETVNIGEDYDLRIFMKNDEIVETQVETKRTKLTYTKKDGERIFNKGNTKNEVVFTTTLVLWCFLVLLIFVVYFICLMVSLYLKLKALGV